MSMELRVSDHAERRIRGRGIADVHIRMTLDDPDIRRPQAPNSTRFRARRAFGDKVCEVDYFMCPDGVAEVYSARYVG